MVVSATNTTVQKKLFGSGMYPLDLANRTTSRIWNEEIDGLMKMVKSLVDAGLLIKEVGKTIQNEAKEQKSGFFWHFTGYTSC